MTPRKLLVLLLVALAVLLLGRLLFAPGEPEGLERPAGPESAAPPAERSASPLDALPEAAEAIERPAVDTPATEESPREEGDEAAGEAAGSTDAQARGAEASGEEGDATQGTVALDLRHAGKPITTWYGWFIVLIPHDPTATYERRSISEMKKGLAPGRWTVRVMSPFATLEPVEREVVVSAGKSTELAIDVPGAGTMVELRFVGADGQPVAGLQVGLALQCEPVVKREPRFGGGGGARVSGGRTSRQRLRGWTMAENSLNLSYEPAADGTLRFASAGRLPVTVSVALEGQHLHKTVLQPGVTHQTITVVVPPPQITLELPALEGRWGSWYVLLIDQKRVERSLYEKRPTLGIRGVKPGRYVLYVQGGKEPGKYVGWVEVSDTPQTLRPAITKQALAGCDVVDASTDVRLPKASVRWLFDGTEVDRGWEHNWKTERHPFEVDLPAGVPVTLIIEAKGYAPQSRELHLDPGEYRDLGTIALAKVR